MFNPNKPKKRFNRPYKKEKSQTTEEKIKQFILRNSRNGFFTRIPTLSSKFQISDSKAWEIIGTLLAEDVIEAYHDSSGKMKVCASGDSYKILNQPKNKKNFEKKNI